MIQSPYFDINYGWPYGSDGWNTGMDENLVRLSFLARNAVNEFVNTLPPSPAPGYSCILNSDGLAYVWLGDGYVFTPLEDGYEFLTLADGKYWRKDGPSYIEIPSPISLDDRATSLESRMGVVENDLSQVISDASDTAQEVGDILSDASTLPVTSDSVTQSLAAWMDFVRNRTNHTGTQEASTISDFTTEVVDSFISQLSSQTLTASTSGDFLFIEDNNSVATEVVSDGTVLELPDSGGVYSPLHENISSVVLGNGELGTIRRVSITFRQDDTTPYTVGGWGNSVTWLAGSPPAIDPTLESETLIELVNIDNRGWLGWKVGTLVEQLTASEILTDSSDSVQDALDSITSSLSGGVVNTVDGMTGDVQLGDKYEIKRLNNLTASTDPGANNDSTEGYSVLSRWVNISTQTVWMALDVTQGNAIWSPSGVSIGDLGSAALADTGMGADNVPTNAMLGSAAYQNVEAFDPAGSAASALSSANDYTDNAINSIPPTKAANLITLTDSGDYFTSSNVEGALQEVGGNITEMEGDIVNINSTIGDIASALDAINGEVI